MDTPSLRLIEQEPPLPPTHGAIASSLMLPAPILTSGLARIVRLGQEPPPAVTFRTLAMASLAVPDLVVV